MLMVNPRGLRGRVMDDLVVPVPDDGDEELEDDPALEEEEEASADVSSPARGWKP